MLRNLRKYKALYIMTIPGILFFLIFKYIPLMGNIIAFQNYNIFQGLLRSPFVGLENFRTMFQYKDFLTILCNTLIINAYDLLFGFTAPILLALLINEIDRMWFKRAVQQVVYLPHFLSWVVLGGVVTIQVLSPEQGMLNMLLQHMGTKPVYFMIQPQFARAIVVISDIYRDIGWGSIVYLAALTSVNPSLYEAADIDGAGKFRQLLAITLPEIMPIIMTMFLMRLGHFMDFGFERIWVFENSANYAKLEIFDTYVYKVGILQGKFSYTTAVGLFKSLVSFLFLFSGNTVSKKLTGESLY